MTEPRRRARLVALTALAALLFSPPLVLVFDVTPSGDGPSWLPLYLFLAWALVIGLAAWLMEQREEEP
ncbi:hypothetical protein [Billgrantia gudaonensis]|uniref:Uncharacterized protein n=1 Tax=Billgrantia gudaonensis TaxID=376427 RepID=A0A1G9D6T3_9GAMM|nr:hypothetical protein [Halomonas gudaonensis]SDK59646.1 hypothetical protein SAMN04487954_12035 [Halomonas gudaonensis]